jgi:ATP-dependent RNA helicase DDX21
VPAAVLPHFYESAEQLIASKGAKDALAAALAHISGSTEIKTRSLLSSQGDLQTFKFTYSLPLHNRNFL